MNLEGRPNGKQSIAIVVPMVVLLTATNSPTGVSILAGILSNQIERTTMRTVALVTLLAAFPAIAAPQQVSSQSRAQQLAAAFTKQKHVVAEKRGVRTEKYKDVRSDPVVKQDVTECSGIYQVVDLGDVIDLRIGSDGRIEADGHDSDQPSRTFVLENGKIAGAVLTAIKVYRDGETEPFEGVFAGNTYERLFYQLKQ